MEKKQVRRCEKLHFRTDVGDNMKTRNLLAENSREFFEKHKINRYRMKKVSEMSDEDVITYCHWFCEENKLTDEWDTFRQEKEAEYRYCSYLKEFIDDGLCADIQMISGGFIKSSALPETDIDKEESQKTCRKCKYCL